MVLKTYSNTDSSPTSSSSSAWRDSVSLDGSKCRRVGDGGYNSLWFPILTLTLRLSVSPLLHVGTNHVHFCQMDPGNSWTLGRALHTTIYLALTWHVMTNKCISSFGSLSLYLSLTKKCHKPILRLTIMVEFSWGHLIHLLPRISSHTLFFMPGIT